MASRVRVEISSDLSGDPEASPVEFGLNGHVYEIDLTADERAELERLLGPYVSAARSVSGRRAGKRPAAGARSGPAPEAVRAWAVQNGVEVPSRGRIPGKVLEQYEAAVR